MLRFIVWLLTERYPLGAGSLEWRHDGEERGLSQYGRGAASLTERALNGASKLCLLRS